MSISQPEQIDIDHIAEKLKVNIYYADVSFRFRNNIFIQKSTKQREWQLFGHEIAHYLLHSGSQLNMYYLFRDLQEYQANHFAYHFCVPTFMLDNLKEVNTDVIMDNFNVEFEFALKRLDMYQWKVFLRQGGSKHYGNI